MNSTSCKMALIEEKCAFLFPKLLNNFLLALFLKISETLKAHISGTEADIDKQEIAFFLVFKPSFILANKKIVKNLDAYAL